MAGKTRREEYAELTRAAVVSAAIARFTADGYAATTIDAIAEEARVTKGGVYHHFADKAELFEAAFVAMQRRLLERIATGLAGLDAETAIVAGMDLFLDECAQDDFRRIVLEQAPAALGWARWKKIDEAYFLGMFVTALGGLVATSDYEIPDLALAARVLMAAMDEAALAVAAAPDPDLERERARVLLRQLLRGFRVTPG
ncbi:MAG TPA: TetR family transcriptional regulator [Streptosporangiaceae bacterium]|jgi:AcrR family transcriptional regulator|nr:TetR family transcriptional regulator [Streptosporangiaceae bacterium]